MIIYKWNGFILDDNVRSNNLKSGHIKGILDNFIDESGNQIEEELSYENVWTIINVLNNQKKIYFFERINNF